MALFCNCFEARITFLHIRTDIIDSFGMQNKATGFRNI